MEEADVAPPSHLKISEQRSVEMNGGVYHTPISFSLDTPSSHSSEIDPESSVADSTTEDESTKDDSEMETSTDVDDDRPLVSPLTALTFPPPPPEDDLEEEGDMLIKNHNNLANVAQRILKEAMNDAVLIENIVATALLEAVQIYSVIQNTNDGKNAKTAERCDLPETAEIIPDVETEERHHGTARHDSESTLSEHEEENRDVPSPSPEEESADAAVIDEVTNSIPPATHDKDKNECNEVTDDVTTTEQLPASEKEALTTEEDTTKENHETERNEHTAIKETEIEEKAKDDVQKQENENIVEVQDAEKNEDEILASIEKEKLDVENDGAIEGPVQDEEANSYDKLVNETAGEAEVLSKEQTNIEPSKQADTIANEERSETPEEKLQVDINDVALAETKPQESNDRVADKGSSKSTSDEPTTTISKHAVNAGQTSVASNTGLAPEAETKSQESNDPETDKGPSESTSDEPTTTISKHAVNAGQTSVASNTGLAPEAETKSQESNDPETDKGPSESTSDEPTTTVSKPAVDAGKTTSGASSTDSAPQTETEAQESYDPVTDKGPSESAPDEPTTTVSKPAVDAGKTTSGASVTGLAPTDPENLSASIIIEERNDGADIKAPVAKKSGCCVLL